VQIIDRTCTFAFNICNQQQADTIRAHKVAHFLGYNINEVEIPQ